VVLLTVYVTQGLYICIYNKESLELNDRVLVKFPREVTEFLSIDSREDDEDDNTLSAPISAVKASMGVPQMNRLRHSKDAKIL
jgi:hypothetical protein